jgi:hypothetical protein
MAEADEKKLYEELLAQLQDHEERIRRIEADRERRDERPEHPHPLGADGPDR